MSAGACRACAGTWPSATEHVADLPHTTVYLHEDQFFPGWTVLVLKRHATELFHLDREERAGVIEEVAGVARALSVAAALQQRLAPGERALLLYEGGVDFVTAFLGCLYAGVVAVPAYPPDPHRIHRTLSRLRAIVGDARAGLVLASADILHVAEPICMQADGLRDLIWLGSGPAWPRSDTGIRRCQVSGIMMWR